MEHARKNGHVVEFMEKDHANKVLELVNEDRLPGQPVVALDMLRKARQGISEVDRGYWLGLKPPKIEVLLEGDEVTGVVSYADHKTDDETYLLWLHCREDAGATKSLLDRVLAGSHKKKVCAFHIATPLTSGLEALPRKHRPVMHQALCEAGMQPMDLWRFMRVTSDVALSKTAAFGPALVKDDESVAGWQVTIEDEGVTLGSATIGSMFPGIGVIWLIEVQREHRRKGIGRKLMGSAVRVLSANGAKEIILYVDDDDKDPSSDRNKTAANALYDSIGFEEVDRLFSYDLIR